MKLKGQLEKRSKGILLRILQDKINELSNPKDILRLLNIQIELLSFKEGGE